MGACHSGKIHESHSTPVKAEPTASKTGFLYSEVRKTIRPLDLLLFAGSDEISTMIRFLQVRAASSHSHLFGKSEKELRE